VPSDYHFKTYFDTQIHSACYQSKQKQLPHSNDINMAVAKFGSDKTMKANR